MLLAGWLRLKGLWVMGYISSLSFRGSIVKFKFLSAWSLVLTSFQG